MTGRSTDLRVSLLWLWVDCYQDLCRLHLSRGRRHRPGGLTDLPGLPMLRWCHTEASASVGVSRDARIDGYTPAIIPTSTAPPRPVSADDSGTTIGQP